MRLPEKSGAMSTTIKHSPATVSPKMIIAALSRITIAITLHPATGTIAKQNDAPNNANDWNNFREIVRDSHRFRSI